MSLASISASFFHGFNVSVGRFQNALRFGFRGTDEGFRGFFSCNVTSDATYRQTYDHSDNELEHIFLLSKEFFVQL